MKIVSSVLVLLLTSSLSFAQTTIELECSSVVDGKTESVSLRLDEEGNIVYWQEGKIALAEEDSIFGILAVEEEDGESIFEYVNTFKASNGYSILQAGTTADETKVGISKDLTKGFYQYTDLGSGKGNSKGSLICVQK